MDIIDNAEPSVNMTPCRITRGHFILLAILLMDIRYCLGGGVMFFSCYSNQINLSPLPDAPKPLLYLVSYPVYHWETLTYSLAWYKKRKKEEEEEKGNRIVFLCVCVCVINVQRVFTLRYLAGQKSYQCPVKMEDITRSLRTVIQRLSQQTGGSVTHQKNNVVIIYCCYLSQFS